MSDGSFLRDFTNSLSDPTPSADEQPAPADNSGATDAPAPVTIGQDAGSPSATTPPAQAPAYAPPQPEPFHEDPYVGPNKAVDPKDKIVQTPELPLDPEALKKRLKDPLGTYKPKQDPGGPSFGDPPPGSTPPGPDYTWDPILRGWKRIKHPNSSIPIPPAPEPPAPGDYEMPDCDSAPA